MTKEIRLPAPHPRFRPRVEPDARQPGHPGTAVRIGEDLFEVVAAGKSGGEWIYRLEPWTGRDTIRVYVEWGEESEREFGAVRRAERIRGRKDSFAWAAQPFLGFLPAPNQERLHQARGLDPARATFWSAMLETVLASPFALLFVISFFAGGAGGRGGSVPTWAGLLALVAVVDGAIRLAVVISTGEPIGSLLLALLGLRIRSQNSRHVPSDEILELGDRLDVVSPVPKPWWEKAGGVTYKKKPYVLVGSAHQKRKFSYGFQEGGAGFPDLDLETEKVRNRSSDLSYALAPLWGFLPSRLQKSLEFYGRYRSRPYVVVSIVFNLLLALALVGPGLMSVSRGTLETWSLLALAAAGALLGESILRLLFLIRDERTTGSLLGFLIKPIYRLAIKDRAVPSS
jgi:hypothetical protein